MNKKPENITNKVKGLLAEHLGLEPDDIDQEDSFVDDLHMQPTDLSDFIENLNNSGIDTTSLDLTKIVTVTDLIDQITSSEYLD